MKYIQKYWILIVIVFFFSMFINPAICILIVGSLVFYIGIMAVRLLKKLQEKGTLLGMQQPKSGARKKR